MKLLNIGIKDLITLAAAALGCLNFFNEIVIDAINNGGKLSPDASKTVDNLLFPSVSLNTRGEFFPTEKMESDTPTTFASHLLSMPGEVDSIPEPIEDESLVHTWSKAQLKLSPNSGALFVSQTLLRNDANSGIYFPSQKFPGGNSRNVDMRRVFCPENITTNQNPGILGTLYGLVGTAFKNLSVYAMAYTVWPYTIMCESASFLGFNRSIPVRTAFTHAQQEKVTTEPEKVFARDVDADQLVDLINLLSMVSYKCVIKQVGLLSY